MCQDVSVALRDEVRDGVRVEFSACFGRFSSTCCFSAMPATMVITLSTVCRFKWKREQLCQLERVEFRPL